MSIRRYATFDFIGRGPEGLLPEAFEQDKRRKRTSDWYVHTDDHVAEVERLMAEIKVYKTVLTSAGYENVDNLGSISLDTAEALGTAIKDITLKIKAERDSAVRERDEAVGALRPFAALDMSPYEGSRDGRTFYQLNETEITVGDIRRARAALVKIEGGRG